MKEIIIASIGNSYVDFSKLDLSPWKIKGGKLLDKNTKKNLVDEFQLNDLLGIQLSMKPKEAMALGCILIMNIEVFCGLQIKTIHLPNLTSRK